MTKISPENPHGWIYLDVENDKGRVISWALELPPPNVLKRNGLTTSDLDLFVSHQANRRIIMSAAERLGLSPEKVVINIEKYGNTTAGTIPLALAEAVADGRLKKGNLVLLASVGAGFTVGSVLLRWSI